MNDSLILKTSARYLLVTALLLSLVVLLRGHNEPGGGFIGGLIGAAGFAFYGVAHGQARTYRLLRLHPLAWCGVGLLLGLGAGIPAMLAFDDPLLTQLWAPFTILGLSIGTTIIFDAGVYLAVLGFVLGFLLPFFEE